MKDVHAELHVGETVCNLDPANVTTNSSSSDSSVPHVNSNPDMTKGNSPNIVFPFVNLNDNDTRILKVSCSEP